MHELSGHYTYDPEQTNEILRQASIDLEQVLSRQRTGVSEGQLLVTTHSFLFDTQDPSSH